MHICHIQNGLSIEHGGPTQSLANYCRGQAAAGHRVSVWTVEGFSGRSPALRLPPPIEMHVFQVDPPAKLGRSAELCRQLRAADPPGVYHLHGLWEQAVRQGANEARRRKKPYLLEMMGMYEPWALSQKWLPKRLARWWFQDRIVHDAACLHVNSHQEARYLRKLGFKTPIAVIPVGVDMEAIARNQSTVPSAPACEGLGGGPFVLFLSRLHPKKGLDLLIRSWAALSREPVIKDHAQTWKLVIAGTGDPEYVTACRQLAEQLSIAGQCVWTGYVDDQQKSWLLTHAHCYVLPTSSENFGNVIAEALAHGTPVITTCHTPWTDLPKHQCGWIVDNTEAELCPALRQALGLDAATRTRMGLAGETLVRDHYSLQLVLSEIEAVCKWVSGSGPKPKFVS